MRQIDNASDIHKLRRLVTAALAIADHHGLLDVGICLDGALVRLSEVDGQGSGCNINPSLEASDQIHN